MAHKKDKPFHYNFALLRELTNSPLSDLTNILLFFTIILLIKTKSIYDKKEESDGKRILITRYYPRGIRKNNFDRLFNIVHIISNLVAHIKDRSIHETLRTINKIAANPDELAYWTTSVETTAKHMCNDMSDNVTFMYCPEEKAMRLFVKNTESRDCLVKSVEIHLPIVPEPLQGFFSVFKYNLKNMKFD